MKARDLLPVEINPTKIVCTLGPATENPSVLAGMLAAGMDVARLNLSHGTHQSHADMLGCLRETCERTGRHVGVIADLQGPKIRTGALVGGGPVRLIPQRKIIIDCGMSEPGDAERLSTTYEHLADDVRAGEMILLDDGQLQLRVDDTCDGCVTATVIVGGLLGEHKGMNLPDTAISAPSLTPKDRDDLAFALGNGVDYLALSFVRDAADITELRQACRGLGHAVPIIAKLERPEALEHLPEIIAASDVVMVARGDLGVELPPEHVPVWQKRIIRLCSDMRVPVITATQMLESMRFNPRPTRAEASDVANAILDDTDAVMLSAETSIGSYPVEAVAMMRRICMCMEDEQFARTSHLRTKLTDSDQRLEIADAVSRAAARAAEEVNAAAILAFTQSGTTARMASKCRPQMPIIAVTPLEATARRCSLYWGVEPVHTGEACADDEAISRCIGVARDRGLVAVGDVVVITAGTHLGRPGTTNMMRIHRVRDDM